MQNRKSLFWQIYPSYVWIVLLSLASILLVAFISFRALFLQQVKDGLEARAILARENFASLLEKQDFNAADSLAKRLGQETETRITLLLADGRVVADTHKKSLEIENLADREEVRDALRRGKGQGSQINAFDGEDTTFVAIPVGPKSAPVGVLRLAVRTAYSKGAFWVNYWLVFLSAVLLVALVAVVAWIYAKRISRPLEEMRQQADQITKGETSGVAPTSLGVALEIEGLGQAVNQLAFQLNSRMQTILQQKSEEEAILASMAEGVIAVDSRQRILNLNEAAANFLRAERALAIGKPVEEVVRIPKLQRFIRRVLEGERPLGEELVFDEDDLHWQVYGNSLRDPEGKEMGALIVFSDVSRMRQLESHRRDFVANVSHELRTPLTSIKGFLETLRDGAMSDPIEAPRFLEIALKHTDRLNAIIDDLLKLSRLEKDTDSNEIQLAHGPLRTVLSEAIQLCEIKSRQKQVSLELDCPVGLQALINPPLLEQAVVNLIDNAVKFSDEGGKVEVRGRLEGEDVVITVKDFGQGIAPEHLSRIFERFYRVDKARSRNMGGTGLGLAIVKHVALAHRGVAGVRSTAGQGSEFSLRLRALT